MLLDGVDDYARATTVFPDTTIAQSFTVEAWIYHTAADDVVDASIELAQSAADMAIFIADLFMAYLSCVLILKRNLYI